MMETERHPFEPFLPEQARILFLGSFPPQPKRWSMPFYYPNWNNDFWRVMGLLFFDDKDHFNLPGQKRFDQPRVEAFCREQGIALYEPPVGGHVEITIGQDLFAAAERGARTLQLWRMPSTSRAYPLALDRKAAFYRRLWP